MIDPANYADCLQKITAFQQRAAETMTRLTRPVEKQVLGDLLSKIEQARAEVEATYPAAMQALQEQAAITRANYEALKTRRAERQQQRAQAAQAPRKTLRRPTPPTLRKEAVAPRLPRPTIDPNLGPRLREELLARFVLPTTPAPRTPNVDVLPRDQGGVWEMVGEDWNEVETAAPGAPPTGAPPQVAPLPPEAEGKPRKKRQTTKKIDPPPVRPKDTPEENEDVDLWDDLSGLDE